MRGTIRLNSQIDRSGRAGPRRVWRECPQRPQDFPLRCALPPLRWRGSSPDRAS